MEPTSTYPDALVKPLKKIARCMSAPRTASPTARRPSSGPAQSPLDGPLAFEMGGEMGESSDSTHYGEGANGLLIVNGSGEAPAPQVEVGQTVEVSGTVREFDLQEVERRIGTDLAAGAFTYWTNQPVLFATSIEQQGAETKQE